MPQVEAHGRRGHYGYSNFRSAPGYSHTITTGSRVNFTQGNILRRTPSLNPGRVFNNNPRFRRQPVFRNQARFGNYYSRRHYGHRRGRGHYKNRGRGHHYHRHAPAGYHTPVRLRFR